ncbi:phospholipase D family protein [Marinimicrobium sp. C2-29]|uniref:phospholipase D family protein n=1 Tax=Marinimicrobium sp. C2-29 TaxID=3139825 RepID=UPI0031389A06
MLSPDSRIVAMDQLKPPPGYRLDFTVLTTYSLDLEVLLALPLAVLAQAEEGVEELLQDPLLLLEALREAGERVQVFVDEGGVAIPGNSRALYSALEASVHPVRAPNGGAFHPKVWVARFVSEDRPPLIRVSVASRNLTFDRSWDLALTSEATVGKKVVAASKPLATLLRRLPALGREPQQKDRASAIEQLASEVQRTVFPAPEGFTGQLDFQVLGLGKKGALWKPVEQARRVLAIAPFVSAKTLHSVAWIATHESQLVSRSEELAKLTEDLNEDWDGGIRVLHSSAEGEPEDGSHHRPSGLHAKALVFEQGHQATWFIGSANLTDAAFSGRNVEVMASISGPKGRSGGDKGVGIDQFLNAGFLNLCEDYQPQERMPESDEALEVAEKLKQAQDALLGSELKVACHSAEQDWQLAVQGHVEVPEGVQVSVWPLSVEEHQAKTFCEDVSWALPIARLTAFVAFSLKVVGYKDELRFVLKLAATGMPESRLHHVLRTLIDSPERFLQLLRALLGGLEEMNHLIGDKTGDAWQFSSTQGLRGEPLLEDILRSASRDPQRLVPIRRLIADLRESEEGREIVSDELYELWQVVDAVLDERLSS